MNVLILNTQVPFCRGGAEVLAEDLLEALVAEGHQAEILTVPFKWYPQDTLVNSIVASKLLDVTDYNNIKIDRVICLKFPLWLVNHPAKTFWILHQHRTAYELWDTDFCDLMHMPDGQELRAMIHHADNQAFKEAKSLYTISNTVSDRLAKYNNFSSEILYPPPRNLEQFTCESYGDYMFFPSRISPIKRQELVIEALAKTTESVKVVFAGDADNPEYLERLKMRSVELGVADRIQWLGRISEQDKISYYANALAVVFTPKYEDYGYITPEAMLSSKAVLTLSDAGGPLEFVVDHETGLIAEPCEDDLAAKLDELWSDRQKTEEYGINARKLIDSVDLSWSKVISRLLQ
jgi:glycosyltransferase involved in cell wall biosynthesis